MSKFFFKLSLSVIVLHFSFCATAQDYAETALLFSRTRPAGSARIQALGGSSTALGGDYSAALSNPAGLGMFNRSEFTFSLGLNSNNTSALYLGNASDDSRTTLNVPGISVVLHMPKESKGFLGGSLGISFSRTNDFNRSTVYKGFNDNNSIIDYFIDDAFGSTTSQFDEGAFNYNTPTGLAYFNYLIGPTSILNPPGPATEYFTDADYPFQQEETTIKGASNQWSISYGGNIKDKFFFGGGIGISSLRYESQKIFTETFDQGPLQNLRLVENLQITGTGLNATLGGIVRPTDFIQVGISYTTPTIFGLTETYDASMSSRWNNYDYYGDGSEILGDNSNDPVQTDIITSEYNLTTPSRLSTGVTFISKYGFLTGDVEIRNFNNAKYSSDTPGISYTEENNDVKAAYQSVINYRIGAEYRYNVFRVRAGYGIQANTYKDGINADNTITSFTGGLGVRTKSVSVDFALINSRSKTYPYLPYTFSDGSGPIVNMKNRITTGMITVGFTF